jgi:hypothetical protein
MHGMLSNRPAARAVMVQHFPKHTTGNIKEEWRHEVPHPVPVPDDGHSCRLW